MNKKLLMAALAAVLVVPLAANAGVKVYGAVQFELASDGAVIDTDGSPLLGDPTKAGDDGAKRAGYTTKDNGRGRFGIKASEDLGGGIKGIAKLEWAADTTDNNTDKSKVSAGGGGTNGNAALTGRNSHVGIKGGFGTFLMGRLKVPYKYMGGVKYDPFVTTNLQARKNGGMGGGADSKKGFNGGDDGSSNGHNSFMSNTLGYLSPNWGGFKLWLTMGWDQGGDTRKKEDTCSDDDGCGSAGSGNYGDYQLGARFGMKGAVPFEVGFVQNLNASRDDRASQGPAGNDEKRYGDATAFKIFASVGMKTGRVKHKIVLQHEKANESVNGAAAGADGVGADLSERSETVTFLGYHLGFGKTTLVFQTAQSTVDYDEGQYEFFNFGGAPYDKTRTDQTGTYSAFGVIHKFSKKTRFFAGWRANVWDDYKGVPDAHKAEAVITVGLRKDF